MNFVILDLEWDNAYISKESGAINEIIEFGAVKFDENLNEIGTFSELVKQKIGKFLHHRTEKLTNLSRKDLFKFGKSFDVVMKSFLEFLGDSVLMSWSRSDLVVLMENYNYYNKTRDLSFLNGYVDIQQYCHLEMKIPLKANKIGLSAAAELLQINQESFEHHRALDDSLLTFECLKKIYNKEHLLSCIETTDKKYFERLVFKPHYLKRLYNNSPERKELYIHCPTCGKKLESQEEWNYKNNWFRCDLNCSNCGRTVNGGVQFKVVYDGKIIKRNFKEIKIKDNDGDFNMATIIDGKIVSAYVRKQIIKSTEKLGQKGIIPGLAVIIVGNDPASKVYVRNKKNACAEVGFYSEEYALPEETTENELIELIQKLNFDKKIHGILVQLPLPKHINEKNIIKAISPKKDVDGFSAENVGNCVLSEKGFKSCTPAGIIELLNYYNIEIEGKNCVVLGRSNIVGKPMALLLLEKNATVTICHSKTKNISDFTKNADILVVAVGKRHFVNSEMVKDGAVVIDVGINRDENNKLCGDVDFDSVSKKASYITPVPGGVGPMTITMLLKNTLLAAENDCLC